jgi:DHA2 family multidrug resistance protein-like MFS transporter
MLATAPRDRAGAAGGMLATARLTGMTLGATIAALVFRVAPHDAERVALLIGVALAVAGAAASVTRLSKRVTAGALPTATKPSA